MIKRTAVFITSITLFSATLFAQDAKKEVETIKTKMDVFSSKTGSITKYIDTKLPALKTTYATVENRVRKITSGNITGYFYQIEKEGKYSNSTASIEYLDLLEILKALQILKQDLPKDLTLNPDYLENKFITVDGFNVGYFVSKGKATWYITLEKYGSDNTLIIENVDVIETAFTKAKNTIEELKK